MATTLKRRGSLGARSTYGGYSSWGNTSTNRSSRSSTVRGRSNTGTKRIMGIITTPAGYRNVSSSIQRKIDSYKMLFDQTQGAAKFQRPSPNTINSFCNWVNKGAVVQTVSPVQLVRWARTANKNFNSRHPTVAACKDILCLKFGKTTIKAIARAKNGSFLVATSPTRQGRPFCFPK